MVTKRLDELQRPKESESTAWMKRALSEVMARASLGPDRALPNLRRTAVLPVPARGIADLAERAQFALARSIADLNPETQQAIEARVEQRRQQLLAEGASALEQILIEQVLTCELAVALAARPVEENEGISIQQGDFLQRRQDAAHRRLMHACRTLAYLRRLRLPAVQLNVAERQVNILGPGATG